MAIYICLLLFIFIMGFTLTLLGKDSKKSNKIFLNIVFIAIFLVYSLRASSVGRDLPGYERVYNYTFRVSFFDFDYIYFENGYVLLMKLCALIGLNFQWFLTICNFIILFPIYLFIKKYSKNPFLSVIIYVCYMFFEFNMTGIRQAIATSIVLLAIYALIESKRCGILYYIAICYIATLFHKGAFIGFLYIPFHYVKKQRYYAILSVLLCLFFLVARGAIMSFVKDFFEKDTMDAGASLYIGLNFIFLVGCGVLFIISGSKREKYAQGLLQADRFNEVYAQRIDVLCEKMFLLSIATLLLFGSDNSVRSYMLLNQVIIILLPNSLGWIFDRDTKSIIEIAFVIFFVVFMFIETLFGSNFDIVPYKFFWQT